MLILDFRFTVNRLSLVARLNQGVLFLAQPSLMDLFILISTPICRLTPRPSTFIRPPPPPSTLLVTKTFLDFPWGAFTGVPPTIAARFGVLDRQRLYIESQFDSYWYLGERMAAQTGDDGFVVPADPPKVLFEQTPDADVRRVVHREGESDSLLRPAEDYASWARRSLGPAVVEPRDPDMDFQPPPFPEVLEFEHGECPHRFELLPCSSSAADGGMQLWGSRVKKAFK